MRLCTGNSMELRNAKYERTNLDGTLSTKIKFFKEVSKGTKHTVVKIDVAALEKTRVNSRIALISSECEPDCVCNTCFDIVLFWLSDLMVWLI